MNDIKELLNQLEQAYKDPRCIDREKAQRYYNAVTDLQQQKNKLEKIRKHCIEQSQKCWDVVAEEIYNEIEYMIGDGNE